MDTHSLVCSCGQTMSVPETAIGRVGLCPACGAEIAITRERLQQVAVPPPPRAGGGLLSRKRNQQVTQSNESREDAWRKFATAVDLYNGRRYAEALTLLNTLQQTFPGNPHVDAAQAQCAEALREAAAPRLEYAGTPVDEATLSEALVKSVVLKKMLHGATEDIQLQAAELGARLLGLLQGGDTARSARAAAPSPVIVPAPTETPTRPEEAPAHAAPSSSMPRSARRKNSAEEIA